MTVLAWGPISLQSAARHHPAVRALRCVPDVQDWDDNDAVVPSHRDDASSRALAVIERFVHEGLIPSVVAVRARGLIAYLFKPNTVDAAISPDDDGLCFYWAAQEMSLTVIVYTDAYWWSVSGDADSYSGGGAELPLLDLQHSLNQFSKEVARRNPKWRSLIR